MKITQQFWFSLLAVVGTTFGFSALLAASSLPASACDGFFGQFDPTCDRRPKPRVIQRGNVFSPDAPQGNNPVPSNPEPENPATVQPSPCFNVDSRAGWQSVVVPQGHNRIASLSGGWSVDANNYALVGAEGHTGFAAEALAPFSQYKFVNWAPFGALILEDDSEIAAVNVGSQVIPPDGTRTVKFRINDKDEALGDNQGSLQVCFGLGSN